MRWVRVKESSKWSTQTFGSHQVDHPRQTSAHGPASIRFENVNFTYPSRKENPVLVDLSFEIKAGQTIAIVGPSGSGKSTIASLLTRFYDPDSGQIFFNGEPIAELDLHFLRKQISVVPQHPQVFSVSISDNIRYGNLGASDNEVKEAAKAANIDSFVESLPNSYDTLVGDKGIQLSGGERQRVANCSGVN